MDQDGSNIGPSLDNTSNDVVFEDDAVRRSVRMPGQETPKIVQMVINYSGGYIKNERQASYVLFALVVVTIVITLVLVFGAGSSGDLEKRIPIR